MKFKSPKINFKLPSVSAIKEQMSTIIWPSATVPKHAKWALALVAGLVALGFVAYFGYFVLLLAIIVGTIVASYWPGMLGFLVVGSVVGGAISRRRETGVIPGLCAGVFYALLSALSVLIVYAAYVALTGAH